MNQTIKNIFTFLLACCFVPDFAQTSPLSQTDTVSVGYDIAVSLPVSSYSATGVDAGAFVNAAHIDVTKALYGKIAGLNVYQGVGSSADNVSRLSVHGKTPLVLVDGFPRDFSNLTSEEIESVTLFTDAASAALYGMKGANGVLYVTTKKGTESRLNVTAKYQFGINTQFRAPEFADAFTYANCVNVAMASDGLAPRYGNGELDAFKNGNLPYDYPNVNWWKETLNDLGFTHSLKLTFDGGSSKFRYYTVIDYYRDRSMLKENTTDKRYSTMPTDTRLTVRTNLDLDITRTTFFRAHIAANLMELRGTAYGRNNIMKVIWNTPSAAFPVKYGNGIYGGNQVYGENNPVALLMDKGHVRNMYGTLLADLSLKQELDMVTKGLSAELLVSFDNRGGMNETSSKSYRYMHTYPTITEDGTLVTSPVIYGKDSQELGHSQPFNSLMMRSNFQAKLAYDRNFNGHNVHAAAMYDYRFTMLNGRNNTTRNQSAIFNATYSYRNRYEVNAVVNYSGSAYLPKGSRYHLYPAVSAAWNIAGENFLSGASWLDVLKIRASYGLSGWDNDLTHELWRQTYGAGNGYVFGSNASAVSGSAEGDLPVVGLKPEKSEKVTLGLDFAAFGERLNFYVNGFRDYRSDVLVTGASSTSEIIGVGVGKVCEGEYLYKGLDLALSWIDRTHDFTYGISATASYLNTEIINENQAYQEYDYLYHTGNRIGQCYGLEAIGFFSSQMEINNSPQQTFSTVRPGDVRYKDQNGDNVIDSKDVVRMFGSTLPRFYFGFNIELGYKGFELAADFQGMTGVTVSLLDSPLYKPLVENGNISATWLNREIPWSEKTASTATMPRLTTQGNANNYRESSLWYRDGSFIKLRNLVVSYTFPKSMLRFADMKIFLQGCNLFSLDNLGFADPEQLQTAYPSVRTFQAGVKFNF